MNKNLMNLYKAQLRYGYLPAPTLDHVDENMRRIVFTYAKLLSGEAPVPEHIAEQARLRNEWNARQRAALAASAGSMLKARAHSRSRQPVRLARILGR